MIRFIGGTLMVIFVSAAGCNSCRVALANPDKTMTLPQQTAHEFPEQAVKLVKEKGPGLAKESWEVVKAFGRGLYKTADKHIPHYDDNGRRVEP